MLVFSLLRIQVVKQALSFVPRRRLTEVQQEINGIPTGFGTLVAIATNRVADTLFISPEACMSYCVFFPLQTAMAMEQITTYTTVGEYVGELGVDPGSQCVKPPDANRPTRYLACRHTGASLLQVGIPRSNDLSP